MDFKLVAGRILTRGRTGLPVPLKSLFFLAHLPDWDLCSQNILRDCQDYRRSNTILSLCSTAILLFAWTKRSMFSYHYQQVVQIQYRGNHLYTLQFKNIGRWHSLTLLRKISTLWYPIQHYDQHAPGDGKNLLIVEKNNNSTCEHHGRRRWSYSSLGCLQYSRGFVGRRNHFRFLEQKPPKHPLKIVDRIGSGRSFEPVDSWWCPTKLYNHINVNYRSSIH